MEISRALRYHERSDELLDLHYDLIDLEIDRQAEPGSPRSYLAWNREEVGRSREELEEAFDDLSLTIMRDTFGEEITSRLIAS